MKINIELDCSVEELQQLLTAYEEQQEFFSNEENMCIRCVAEALRAKTTATEEHINV